MTVVDSLVPELGGNRFNIAPVEGRLAVSTADIRDAAADDLVEGQDVVFSIAGNVSHIDSMTDPIRDLELNCRAQLALLEALRRKGSQARVVYAGSRQQYGRPRYLPLDEHHPLERDRRQRHQQGGRRSPQPCSTTSVHGLPTCSLRLTNTYGPRMQMRHPRQGFVAWFVRLAIEGRGDRALRRRGVASRLQRGRGRGRRVPPLPAPRRGGRRGFNLGHPEPVTIRQFAETLLDVAGWRARCVSGRFRRIAPGSTSAASSRTTGRSASLLGWEPRVGLREGLTRMVEYYRRNREHYW